MLSNYDTALVFKIFHHACNEGPTASRQSIIYSMTQAQSHLGDDNTLKMAQKALAAREVVVV
jgi:hypothetical protein